LNVLSITIDDMNNWVGCLGGHPDALTPNVDALAAGGRLFRRAYSPGTNCNGTRTAVLTGVRPWTSGVYTNRDEFPADRLSGTLPAVFRAQGYEVLAGGKVFHLPTPEVWDELFQPEAPDLFAHRTAPNEYGFPENAMFNWGPVKFPDAKTWDGQLAGWAVDQLARDRDKPFLMCVGFFQPHLPWWVPRRYFRPFKPGKVALPDVDRRDLADVPRFARLRSFGGDFKRVLDSRQWPYAVASYLAAMHFIDALVGQVLEALANGPHAEDTIVVLWSDHGFALGQKLNWHKYLLWEHTTQIPFIVRVPGMEHAGTPTEHPVDLMHVFPTLVDLCGMEAPGHLEGKSLRPLLERPDAEWPLPAISTGDWASHAVRSDRFRYIRYGDGSEELYDHDSDPSERVNLAGLGDYTALKQELAQWLPERPG
jgi:arylsulfatase A-like enzyme